MVQGKKKVVQTELEVSDYETLVSLAKKKSITIKEAAREALRSWNASNADLSDDPLFKLKSIAFRTKFQSDEVEGFLYGKSRQKE